MAQTVTLTKQHSQGGMLRLVVEAAVDDSNQTLTVPAGELWQVLSVYASLATTATAGNRKMRLIVLDEAGAEVGRSDALNVQVASTTEWYMWLPGVQSPTEAVPTQHFMPLPVAVLPAGFRLQILDGTAVAAAADDLTIRVLVQGYA